MKDNDIFRILREIAANWPLPMAQSAPNSIGKAFQSALNIAHSTSSRNMIGRFLINSTTGKLESNGRTNLFAKVPDWRVSKVESTQAFFDTVNRISPALESDRLNCTVAIKAANRRGLELRVQDSERNLWEVLVDQNGVETPMLQWPNEMMTTLARKKIGPQILVGVKKLPGGFKLEKAHVFDEPLPQNFFELVEDGAITVDHLISSDPNTGVVSEKGPSFKIRNSARKRLYGAFEVLNFD